MEKDELIDDIINQQESKIQELMKLCENLKKSYYELEKDYENLESDYKELELQYKNLIQELDTRTNESRLYRPF